MINPFNACLQFLKGAKPKPTKKDFTVQVGVHLEEFAEMLDTLSAHHQQDEYSIYHIQQCLNALANRLKKDPENHAVFVFDEHKLDFLDAICDQLVTATGCAYMQDMDVVGGFNEVNESNLSKFEDGAPVILPGGKIGKGKDYKAPNLSQYLPKQNNENENDQNADGKQ